MAPSQPTPSLDAIVQAGREKKKQESLAQEIFGKNRRSSTPAGRGNGKPHGTLASRITKPKQPVRAASSSALNKLVKKADNTRGVTKGDLFDHAAQTNRQARVLNSRSGLNIRGIAGPAVVIGRNFARGTTAADIQSAIETVSGEMQTCTIVTTEPTVTAEMVFTDKASADLVIATFDNQKADGLMLRFSAKKGPAVASFSGTVEHSQSRPDPPSYTESSFNQDSQNTAEETYGRWAEPEVQDGSFGFDNAQPSQPSQDMVIDVDAEETRLDRPENTYNNGRNGRDNRPRDYERRDDNRRPERDYPRFNRNDNSRHGNSQGYDQRRFNYRPSGGNGYRDDRRLYSDDLYARGRGQTYR